MHTREARIRDALGTWQRALGLRDWDLRVEVVQRPWRKSGDIKIDACNKLAVLMVNEDVAFEFLDEIVVHELIHLKLHPLDRTIEDLLDALYGSDEKDTRRGFAHGKFMDDLESTVQDLTKALLGLAGAPEPMLTPFLRQAVETEREDTAPDSSRPPA